MALNIEKKEAVGETKIETKTGHVKEAKEVVSTVVSTRPLANVGFTVSYTKNLGNYESVKVQVSLHLPVEVDALSPTSKKVGEDLDQAFEFTTKWVENKMIKVIEEIDEEKGKGKSEQDVLSGLIL